MQVRTLSLIALAGFGLNIALSQPSVAKETTLKNSNGDSVTIQKDVTHDDGTTTVNRSTTFSDGTTTSSSVSVTNDDDGDSTRSITRTNRDGETNTYEE